MSIWTPPKNIARPSTCGRCGGLRREWIREHRRHAGFSYHRVCCCSSFIACEELDPSAPSCIEISGYVDGDIIPCSHAMSWGGTVWDGTFSQNAPHAIWDAVTDLVIDGKRLRSARVYCPGVGIPWSAVLMTVHQLHSSILIAIWGGDKVSGPANSPVGVYQHWDAVTCSSSSSSPVSSLEIVAC